MKKIVLLLIFNFSLTHAETIEPNLSSYPKFILALMNYVPRWSPVTDLTEQCRQNFTAENCRAAGSWFPLNSLRSKLFFDFELKPENGFRKIDFQLNPELKIRGILGLHAGQVRPLIIFRMGIHGNRDEYIAERYLLKIFYEDLGYHVLTLESLTSHGFILSNKQVSFGGFEEGLHTFYVLNQLRKGELDWAKQISDIHLAALSMGGSGAFLTTYLDEQTHRQLKSVQMFCPLVNLQENFARMSEASPMNAFADFWNSMRLVALREKIPDLNEIPLWKMLLDFKPRYAPKVLEWLNQNQSGPLLKISDIEARFPDVKLPPEFKKHIDNSKSFYELNQFWPMFKNEETPIQIITTPNDLLVLNELNSDRIREGKQAGIFKRTKFIELQGFHCSLAEEYQWPFLVDVIRRGFEVPRDW